MNSDEGVWGGEMREITSLADDIIRREGKGVRGTQVATEIFMLSDYFEHVLTRRVHSQSFIVFFLPS